MRNGKITAKVLALVLITALAVLSTTSCTTYDNFKEAFFNDKGVVADTVRIGILEPQTGNDSEFGELEIQGIELARELVPEVLGKEVELVYGDTQSSIYVAESAAEDLIAKKPAVVLGSYGDAASLIASRHLGEVKIPAITITATNPLITANNEYYFRMAFTDANQGKALAEYVFNGLQLKEAAILRTENEDSTAEISSAFSKHLVKLTNDEKAIQNVFELSKDKKDYTEEVTALKESGVKAVFMPVSLTAAEKVFKAADKQGISDIYFIGPKTWLGKELIALQNTYPKAKIAVASDIATKASGNDQPSKTAQTVSADALADAAADTAEPQEQAKPTESMYDNFLKAYKAKYKNDNPPEAVALAFDAYMIAVSAIEKAGSIDGYLIKDALKTTSHFDGASGTISFDESGEPKKTINVDVIVNGRFVSVYTAE